MPAVARSGSCATIARSAAGPARQNDELAVDDDDWRGSCLSSCWYQRDTPPSRAFAEQIGRAGMIALRVGKDGRAMHRFHIEIPDDLWERFKTRAIQVHGSPRQAALSCFAISSTDRTAQSQERPMHPTTIGSHPSNPIRATLLHLVWSITRHTSVLTICRAACVCC